MRASRKQPSTLLARRLKELREGAGLTGAELAHRAGWGKSRSKVSKIESGDQTPSRANVIAWAQACAPAGQDALVPELLELLRDAEAEYEQRRHQQKEDEAARQAQLQQLMRDASVIRNFEVTLIPGFLQTPEYARYRALESVRLRGQPEDQVQAVVGAHMTLQSVLYEPGKRFEFVVCEAALRTLLCPPEVMIGQLDRLLLATGIPNVTLGIIPFGRVLSVAPMNGFTLVDRRLTLVETFTGPCRFVGDETDDYGRHMDALMAESVAGEEARQLIMAAAAALRAG